MRVLDDIERIVWTKPDRLPRLEAGSTCERDLSMMRMHRPDLLYPYLMGCEKATPDAKSLVEQIFILLEKEGIKSEAGACEAMLKILELRAPQHVGQRVSCLFFDCLRKSEVGRQEVTMDMLIDKFDVAMRRDLSSAKDETWDGLEAVGQHFRSQGMLIRFGTNHEAEQRHRENGCRVVRKLLAKGAGLESEGELRFMGQHMVFRGVLHRACYDHDKNPDNDLPINIFIDCGADWKKLLDQDLVSEGARAIIEAHPVVRRAKLEALAEPQKSEDILPRI